MYAQGGFTLMEVLIALGIFAIGILGVASMQLSSTNGNTKSRKYTESSEFGQGQIETLMAAPFASLADGNTVTADGYRVTWTILNQSDTNGDGTDDMMVIRVNVDDPQGVERSVYTFSRFLTIGP